jgi:uncharacterized membrane protein
LSEIAKRDEIADESDRLHLHVRTVLRVGLFLSVVLIASGLALHLAHGVDDAPAVRLGDLFAPSADSGLVLTALGTIVLALTPAFRVLALVGLWLRERDYRFVVVALAVVATLAASVLLGKGG